MKSTDPMAASLPGHNPDAMPVHQVSEFLAQLVQPVTPTERVGVFAALGRVLARDVVSPISVPPHNNSAMDGFAFDSTALRPGQALRLRVVGTAWAGTAWTQPVALGQCLRIMTGAVMPAGLDTVVPLERVTCENETVELPADAVKAGANRRLAGEDLMVGQPALRQGQRLGPAALGLIASLGLTEVEVFRRIRVAYFSTGNEILSLGDVPREGAVFDSNRYTVHGLLARLGIDMLDLGVVKDEPRALEAAFRQAVPLADAIITSGGMSTGEADHTQTTMQRLGDVAFWRIAMRPGRPMAVGRLTEGAQSAVLFGLPGNPVAVMVTFLAFVRPALLQLMGCTDAPPALLPARSSEALRKAPGRTEYQRGVVSRDAQGQLWVRTTGHQGSGVLSSMAQAHGLIVLHHDRGPVAVGEMVDVMVFDGAM